MCGPQASIVYDLDTLPLYVAKGFGTIPVGELRFKPENIAQVCIMWPDFVTSHRSVSCGLLSLVLVSFVSKAPYDLNN